MIDRGITGAINTQGNNNKDFVTKEEFSVFKDKFISARVTNIV